MDVEYRRIASVEAAAPQSRRIIDCQNGGGRWILSLIEKKLDWL